MQLITITIGYLEVKIIWVIYIQHSILFFKIQGISVIKVHKLEHDIDNQELYADLLKPWQDKKG